MPGVGLENLRGHGIATFDRLIRLVFPPTCAGCGAAGGWFCERCSESLRAIDLAGSTNVDGGGTSSILVQARYQYAEPLRRAIHLLKYHGQRSRAIWLADQVVPLVDAVATECAVLQPIPLSARRRRERGFNQSMEICRTLTKRTGLAISTDITRIRDTRPQVELRGYERITNVRGAFRATSGMAGRHVILIDDVVTTGSTMRECATACYESGALRVSGIAVAAGGA